jgi:uncharacterized protein (TIGR02118 family)
MVRISILYPFREAARFDATYYVDTHMPLALHKLGAAVRGVDVDVADLSKTAPPPAFFAMCHYLCDSIQTFQLAYGGVATVLQADVANYTDVEPIVQISDVKISRSAVAA